jgi:predicted RNA binding protein YcfA (HicA-like mRNA interferase family)
LRSDTEYGITFEDLKALLVTVGFTERKTSGSHVIFKKGTHAISVPRRKPVKETYVDQVLELVEEALRD